MLTLDQARALLAERVAPLSSRDVPLAEASGCRLASAVVSDSDLPPFDASAMDGYAARYADLAAGTALPVAFEVAAGHLPGELLAGAVARIFTGAPLPAGADTVVPQEEVEVLSGDQVRLPSVPRGSHVRWNGEIVARGDTIGTLGDVVTPQRLAVFAASGVAHVSVVPRPRVAVLVTGDELLAVDEPLRDGRIRNSNGPMLEALASEARLPVTTAELVGDDLRALTTSIDRAAAATELVLASGGVSVGDHDHVPAAVTAAGGEIVLHRVAIQPGKPILVGRVGRAWLVGLPGNPISVLAGWRMFVRPLAETLAGDRLAFREVPVPATLSAPARNPGSRLQLRPGRLRQSDAVLEAEPIPWRGSHDLAGAAGAEALLRLEPGCSLECGDTVRVYPLPWHRR